MLDNRFAAIFIVEDDPGHSKLIERNLRRSGLDNPIKAFENGPHALDCVKGQGNFEVVRKLDLMIGLIAVPSIQQPTALFLLYSICLTCLLPKSYI